MELVLVGDDMKYEKMGEEVGEGIEVRMLLEPREPEIGVGSS